MFFYHNCKNYKNYKTYIFNQNYKNENTQSKNSCRTG